MKKLRGFLVLGTALVLGACGAEETNSNQEETASTGTEETTETLTVGASNVPHAEILEFVKPTLAEEGIDLVIETYTDYVIPNLA